MTKSLQKKIQRLNCYFRESLKKKQQQKCSLALFYNYN